MHVEGLRRFVGVEKWYDSLNLPEGAERDKNGEDN